jgi:hypothetical protein
MLEHHQADPDEALQRFISANQILELSKRIVIKNLAEGRAQETVSKKLEKVPPALALCIMVLGETLSAVLIQSMKSCPGIMAESWQMDHAGGWGPSENVSSIMGLEKFCPRAKAILKGQLGRNAALLLVAVKEQRGCVHLRIKRGSRCTAERCYFVDAYKWIDTEAIHEYVPMHLKLPGQKKCLMGEDCKMAGPNPEAVLSILEESDVKSPAPRFPLFRIYRQGTRPIRLEVSSWRPATPETSEHYEFATISHVWSHGLGNRASYELRLCQLKFIGEAVDEVFRQPSSDFRKEGDINDDTFNYSRYFWLDTIAMPPSQVVDKEVGEGENGRNRQAKSNAVKMIHHIFNQATHGIIIDRHLLQDGANPSYGSLPRSRSLAMRLLSCGWMTRLWTLQEAFVTRQLWVAFVASEEGRLVRVKSYNEMWDNDGEEEEEEGIYIQSMTNMVKKVLQDNLMEEEREARRKAEEEKSSRADLVRSRGHMLLASTWRATRYRVSVIHAKFPESRFLTDLLQTSGKRIKDETKALASLLGLQLQPDSSLTDDDAPGLMRNFWQSLVSDDNFSQSIPPGIIFLAGERLRLPGFGWAPKTWMSNSDESYPYPLNERDGEVDLTPHGLRVRYPGYEIKTTRTLLRNRVLDVSRHGLQGEFEFSSFSHNRGLYDRYRVVPCDAVPHSGLNMEPPEVAENLEDLDHRLESKEEQVKIAIILSRARPVEDPPEIGLLVEIYDPDQEEKEALEDGAGGRGSDEGLQRMISRRPVSGPKGMIYCRVIRRVIVARLSPHFQLQGRSGAAEIKPSDSYRQEGQFSPTTDRSVHQSKYLNSILDRYEQLDSSIAGKEIPENQYWCVDGYYSSRIYPGEAVKVDTGEDVEAVEAHKDVTKQQGGIIFSVWGKRSLTSFGPGTRGTSHRVSEPEGSRARSVTLPLPESQPADPVPQTSERDGNSRVTQIVQQGWEAVARFAGRR